MNKKKERPNPSSPSSESIASHPAQVELAGLRRRLASLLYEALLLLGVLGLTFMVPYLLLGIFFHVTPAGWVEWVHLYVVLGAYFLWYWCRRGQTLAMQTWRLRLVTADGRAPSLPVAWLRYTLAWPSVLCLGFGLAWALIDRDHQFLHDRLAGTRIVLLS
ncbi:MAG TPA: RDD family protein [Aromatoleum sp.]|uniref:RDD family protein n=1 Tax=Aromatoleum sp. TaxID=2307007 RepID=UPI002B4663C9|nr:RDD family protein [Aromatoleum sp.]HJV27220.1 RDD family protein [Aromatoleum sp.]